SDPYWMKNIKRQGTSPFNSDGSYKVYRNVQDPPYNAKGDGSTDDTDAINRAITDGNRCGATTCQSSTLTPALVYFPPGTYIVSAPIIPYYYTSLVGDANKRPTLKASANFNGIAIIDADVYIPGGIQSFDPEPYRSVRNFVLDTTSIPANQFGTGLHWQVVGQATSLINVHVEMSQATGNQHQGIFMENGSGGFMAQLSFNGGKYGMWVSNQQFTIHDVTITNAATGIYQLWNCNCGVGFDLNTGGLTLATQTTSSVVILDSTIHTTPIGVRVSRSTNATGNVLGGSVVLQNVGFDGSVTSGVVDTSGKVLVGGNQVINQFIQGNTYSGTGASPTFTQKTLTGPSIPSSLIDSSTGDIFFRTRPQYQKFAPSQFTSVKDNGAKGDGKTDDTKAIQAVIDAVGAVLTSLDFDAGTYLVTDTIVVPTGTYVVGEFWSTILASGTKFSDASNPKAVLQVGNPGDKGQVEISDMVVSTTGGSAGAIGIEWNADGDQGAMGMWDVHVRIGGAVGTNIQVGNCPSGTSAPTSCQGAFLGFHVAATGGGYFENVWVWAADHDLDDPGQGRINAYSARGIFIDGSSSPVWLVGTAAEHHTLYQYSVVNSANIYMGFIQTETPYYQPTPAPPAPFSTRSDWDDPSFTQSGSAWALVISKSSSVFVYGAGLYSFFVSYTQDCQNTFTCQASLLSVDTDSAAIFVHNLNTIGTTFMMTVGGTHTANQGDNTNGFPSTLTLWS
ncbi:exo-beta-1,3-glucanase, partial [Mycena vulgaris]